MGLFVSMDWVGATRAGFRALMIFLSPAFVGSPAISDENDGNVEGIEFRVGQESLANQVVMPFRFLGRVVDDTHPQWGLFNRPISRFPDAASCLITLQGQKDTVDLIDIDWSKLSNQYELEVCLFRIFSTLKSPELIGEWMEQHGYSVSPLGRLMSESASIGRESTLPVKGMAGFWMPDEYFQRNPSWWYSLTGWTLVKSASLAVQFSENDTLVGVDFFVNTK